MTTFDDGVYEEKDFIHKFGRFIGVVLLAVMLGFLLVILLQFSSQHAAGVPTAIVHPPSVYEWVPVASETHSFNPAQILTIPNMPKKQVRIQIAASSPVSVSGLDGCENWQITSATMLCQANDSSDTLTITDARNPLTLFREWNQVRITVAAYLCTANCR